MPDLVDVPDVVPVAVAVAEVVPDDVEVPEPVDDNVGRDENVPLDDPAAVFEDCEEREAVDVAVEDADAVKLESALEETREDGVTDVLDDTVVVGVTVGVDD